MTTTFIAVTAVWAMLSIVSYLLLRKQYLRDFERMGDKAWTVADRRLALGAAILCPLGALFGAWLIGTGMRKGKRADDTRAKW